MEEKTRYRFHQEFLHFSHLQETAPGRRETFHQHTWLRDGLASNFEDLLSRGSGTLQPRPGSWHGLFCKERCAVPWSLAACERARPPGSASDQPLTPSCKGRGVGLCAGPLFLDHVCPVCEPVPLTRCPGCVSGSPRDSGS